MSFLSRRMREIRYEEEVPIEVRRLARDGVTARFMGKDVDAVTAWRINPKLLTEDRVSYLGRAGG